MSTYPSFPPHTPGPWYVHEQFDGITVVRAVCTPDGRDWSVALVYASLGNAKANARLMAAAPDLLAALKYLRSEFKLFHAPICQSAHDTGDCNCGLSAFEDRCDAALDKAEGLLVQS